MRAIVHHFDGVRVCRRIGGAGKVELVSSDEPPILVSGQRCARVPLLAEPSSVQFGPMMAPLNRPPVGHKRHAEFAQSKGYADCLHSTDLAARVKRPKAARSRPHERPPSSMTASVRYGSRTIRRPISLVMSDTVLKLDWCRNDYDHVGR